MTLLTSPNLSGWTPGNTAFAGVDSDGCVFDTMRIKQQEHFLPLIRTYWHLDSVADALRQAVEFVNLHSPWRGQNRFPNLLRVFERLPDIPGVRESGVPLPDLHALRAYCASGEPLGNPSLQREADRTRDPALQRVLAWSLALNQDIESRMRPCPPFEWARKSLERLAACADIVVVSQTPEAALLKEWRQHHLDVHARAIAGQECGAKTEPLRMARAADYAPDRVLMIGDAPGDAQAASETGALFYPILPEHEEESWEQFLHEALGRFLEGSYRGAYAQARLEEFNQTLSSTAPWAAHRGASTDPAPKDPIRKRHENQRLHLCS